MNKMTFSKAKLKKQLFGFKLTDGILFQLVIYFLLIIIGFVFIYPILVMISYSFMSIEDLLNPMVNQIPSSLSWDNFIQAFNALDYMNVLGMTTIITILPALIQTFVASLVGYGFARFDFKFKKIWMTLVLLTYIIPAQVTMIPKFVLFHNMGILNTLWAAFLPAIFGQGLNSAIFILIFYQFYRMVPKALDEAAQIDGASRLFIYFKIAIPLSIPSFITSILFSFVWQWNETYQTLMLLGDKFQTLQTRLAIFVSASQGIIGSTGAERAANEAQSMAANLLIILPMLILYMILQRWFIEGVDKSGLTGE